MANAGFGQNLPDTIIVLDKDTFKVYRGITSKEVKLKSELSINQYIVHAFPEHPSGASNYNKTAEDGASLKVGCAFAELVL